MKTYVVKNVGEFPMELHFTDGTEMRLGPGKLWIWQGPEANLEFLQEYVDEGKLDVWTFEADWESKQLDPSQLAIAFDWQREGF